MSFAKGFDTKEALYIYCIIKDIKPNIKPVKESVAKKTQNIEQTQTTLDANRSSWAVRNIWIHRGVLPRLLNCKTTL